MQDILHAIKFWLISKFEVQPDSSREEIEFLRMSLAREQQERQKLQDYILSLHEARVPETSDEVRDPKPIGARFTPWHIRKHQLEAEDRQKYRLSKKTIQEELTTNSKPMTTSELEAELLGEQNG